MNHGQRGQAFIETAFFLPLMLLSMMAIIYFSQYGVLQERAPLAARYASLVSNARTDAATNFSIEQMYAEMRREVKNPTYVPLSQLSGCDANAGSDAQATLVQKQALASGSAMATAPPYLLPNAGTASQTGCGTDALQLVPNTSTSDVASAYYSVQYTHVDEDENVPGFLVPVVGSATTKVHSAMSNVRPTSPDDMLYCSPGFTKLLADSLGPSEPANTPYGGYATPLPNAHNC